MASGTSTPRVSGASTPRAPTATSGATSGVLTPRTKASGASTPRAASAKTAFGRSALGEPQPCRRSPNGRRSAAAKENGGVPMKENAGKGVSVLLNEKDPEASARERERARIARAAVLAERQHAEDDDRA